MKLILHKTSNTGVFHNGNYDSKVKIPKNKMAYPICGLTVKIL